MNKQGLIQVLPWQAEGAHQLYHLPWPGTHDCSISGPAGSINYGANKPAKLKGYLEAALSQKGEHGHATLVAVGGAYSNLLLAVAHAAQMYGLHAVCIVRGQELATRPNDRLSTLMAMGADLIYATRDEFRAICTQSLDSEVGTRLLGHVNRPMTFVPEGAAGSPGLLGFEHTAAEWAQVLPTYQGRDKQSELARNLLLNLLKDHLLGNEHAATGTGKVGLLVPMGTGATLAGLRLALPSSIVLVGMSPFDQEYARTEVEKWLPHHLQDPELWRVYSAKTLPNGAPALGGYGRPSAYLLELLRSLDADSNLALNPLYSGLTYAMALNLKQEITEYYPAVQTWFLLDTGGSM